MDGPQGLLQNGAQVLINSVSRSVLRMNGAAFDLQGRARILKFITKRARVITKWGSFNENLVILRVITKRGSFLLLQIGARVITKRCSFRFGSVSQTFRALLRNEARVITKRGSFKEKMVISRVITKRGKG